MKILSAVNSVDEYQALADAGADELYCGIYHMGDVSHGNRALNRREGLSFCLNGEEEFAALNEKAQRDHRPVFVAINSFYSTEALNKVKRQIAALLPLSPHGFIVADIAVLRFIRQSGFAGKISISVGGTVFNAQAARFYQELTADRIILPRHLTLREMDTFADLGLELEVLVLEDRCLFIDGFCNFHHSLPGKSTNILHDNKFLARTIFPRLLAKLNYGSIRQTRPRWLGRKADRFRRVCAYHYKISSLGAAETKAEQIDKLQLALSDHTHVETCGLCRLAEFEERGIGYIKIANRGKLTSHKVQTIALARAAVTELMKRGAPEDFTACIREHYRRIYGHPCCRAHCYYPND